MFSFFSEDKSREENKRNHEKNAQNKEAMLCIEAIVRVVVATGALALTAYKLHEVMTKDK